MIQTPLPERPGAVGKGQSGGRNTANAVLAGLDDGSFRPLPTYTVLIQDGMLQLHSRTMSVASATAFSG